jgi:DNA polymerase-3 subunit delta
VQERVAPRRGQLVDWIRRRAEALGTPVTPRAAGLLAERIGGAVAETDVERGEQTRLADNELRKLATYAGDREIGEGDVLELVADSRPASLYALTNAIDRRDPPAAADALTRAISEGEPPLRIMAALSGRIADLIVTRELVARRATPQELGRRVGRGNVRMAGRLSEASARYEEAELEEMLRALWDADLAIKMNEMEPEPALAAWIGQQVAGRGRRPAPR